MSISSPADSGRPRSRLRLSSPRAATIALFLGSLLIYLATLTQVHTFDALSYVTSVERKPWTEVFHPHHLAYGPLGTLALALGQALGYTGGAALPMQLVNALAGALGVALFFRLVRRVSGRGDVALVAALLLGGAYAYWYYAVEIEVYTVASLFLILCLALMTQAETWSARRGLLLLGFAQAGAVLFHQTNVLLCVPVLVFAINDLRSAKACARASQKDDRRSRFAPQVPGLGGWALRWSTYAAPFVLAVLLPYLYVGIGVSGFRSWSAFEAWLTEYARTGWWGRPITAQKWSDLGKGLADTLAQPGGALLWLLLAALGVVYLRHLTQAPRPLVAALLTWLLVYGAFFFWWEPDNIEFWIAILPPMLLLLALALRGARPWGPGVWLALGVATTTLGLNYGAITLRGDAKRDLQRVIARELGARSSPSDLLVVPDGLIELYLPYYERRENFVSLNQALFEAGDNWAQACGAIQSRIDAALYAGATALVADEALRPPPLLLQRHQVSEDQVRACFARYGSSLQFIPLPPNVPAYWRLPTAGERAAGEGWRFDQFAEGWRAANVDRRRFDRGWRFVPGSDPALTSPLLDIDAGDYQAIEIRMANGTSARDAQLFFAGPDGDISEARSARWTLAPSNDAVTYRIALAEQPGWRGMISRLRLDPVGVGDGGEMRVEWVRLVPKEP